MKAELFGNLNISFHDGFCLESNNFKLKTYFRPESLGDFFPPLLKYSNQNKLLIQGP